MKPIKIQQQSPSDASVEKSDLPQNRKPHESMEPKAEDQKAKRRKATAEWRKRNRDHLREYDRKRNIQIQADPELKKRKLESHRRTLKKNQQYYRQYDRGRDKIKQRARGMVRNHIWRGTLKRLPCEVCGEIKTQAHHNDYTKPLEVRWLCPQHHQDLHHGKL